MEPYQIREDFIRYGVRKEAKKNQYLFDPSREGCDNICFLDEGIAALTRINDDGEEHIYLYFGLAALYHSLPVLDHSKDKLRLLQYEGETV